MALRIKSYWKDDERSRSLPEIASALAYIAWRIALDKAINLHCERFVYDQDAQRLAVIQEYLIFLVQIADRLAHAELNEADRRTLIVEFAKNLFGHVQDNSQDLLGPGDYGGPFIARLDARSADYAEFQFTDDGPSYALLRHLGHEIQTIMGESDANRWVIDQVMDKDGWEAYKHFARAYRNLFE
ncbi:hypothetical protein SAMN05421644_10376 [Allochromatium warmingii]|uniref:Uncharacterized protein n=1 Tax=Allochromatium warmingii TaxID=61595 RepID=A0A1H3BLF3_ALLWA|nr:hypothetical protein [Allochromatium warmingii]SDX42802.1 hypothetical protein SAMN05421644_10376 [Allochromatium warmingii]